MIFNVPGHIEMIRNGLQTYPSLLLSILPTFYVKTQTRRLNRGIYQIGKDYAVQSKRGVKAETDIRIVMDEIWLETSGITRTNYFLDNMAAKAKVGILYVRDIPIFERDAWAEGGYTSEQYEKVFQESSPKWNGKMRWAFKFHVIEVQK